MISSTVFIKQLWEVTNMEKERVRCLLRELYDTGIYAFPCFSQHHAIVFYIDRTTGELISPKMLVGILQDLTRGSKVIAILEKCAGYSLHSWVSNYIRVAG